MADIYYRKYGEASTIDFELYELDGVELRIATASATGDINLTRDEGSTEELDADAFVTRVSGYSLVLSIAEMTAKRIMIFIIDQSATQLWLDKVIIVETYGHVSAMHNLENTSDVAIPGVVAASPTPILTAMASDISIDADEQLNGRTIVFRLNTTTVNLRGQATEITDCTESNDLLTFAALTTLPVSGDTFIVF